MEQVISKCSYYYASSLEKLFTSFKYLNDLWKTGNMWASNMKVHMSHKYRLHM